MMYLLQSLVEEFEEVFVFGWVDYFLVYGCVVDVFEFFESCLFEYLLGIVGCYCNCDFLIVGLIVCCIVEVMGEEYLIWLQCVFFDCIGICCQVLEMDVYGNFVFIGFDYGMGCNWVWFGMFFLQKGFWQGECFFNELFVEQMVMFVLVWEDGCYGFFFWCNGFMFLEDVFFMNGGGGQQVVVVLLLDVVFV